MGFLLILALMFMLGGLVVVIAGVAASRTGEALVADRAGSASSERKPERPPTPCRPLFHRGISEEAALRLATKSGIEDCPIDREPFTIGRRSDCQLVLAHDSVSRNHAQIQRESGRWHIVDSGSANGVYVNGRRVSATALQDGDEIEVGPFRLTFACREAIRHDTPTNNARFEVLDELGHGGMARVYRARLCSDGSIVAVKVPRLELSEDPSELVARFLREAQITARLTHPNIVRVLGHGQSTDETPYMIMEHLPGGSLRSQMAAGRPMTEPDVRLFGCQIASGLAHAHAAGVVHRDIKPENMLFDSRGAIKLTDFGIARGKGFPSLTRSGMVPGTVHYMSPEQAEGAFLTASSDVYALGCVLYEMAVGHCPFEGQALAVLRAHVTRAPEPPRGANPSMSAGLERTILRMIEKSPDARPTAAHVRDMLKCA